MTSASKGLGLLNEFICRQSFEQKVLFVCHASYEKDRAYGSVSAFSEADQVLISDSVVVATAESLLGIEGYAECFDQLQSRLLKKTQAAPLPISVSRPDLVGLTKQIHARFGQRLLSDVRSVIVDASVFPKDRLWIVLDYFTRVNPDLNLFVTYTEPKQYATELDPNGWLSKGVKRFLRVPGFNGYPSPSKKTLLVLIVGHEKERMQITIKNIEPQKIVLVGQGWQQHGDATAMLPKAIVNQLGLEHASLVDTDGSIEIGSRDYLATEVAINDIYVKYGVTHNLIVSGNGTKLQSLGALIACQRNRAIAAVYAEPQVYNSGRSFGTDHSWILQLSN